MPHAERYQRDEASVTRMTDGLVAHLDVPVFLHGPSQHIFSHVG